MKKVLLYLLMLCLILPILSNAQPFQTSGGDEVLDIVFPKITAFDANVNFTTHIHVYNSTGILQTNTTTDCFFHLYNSSGSHLIETQMDFDSNLIDFQQKISKGNITYFGEYTSVIWCNNTKGQGGFVSRGATVTTNGKQKIDSIGLIISFIIISALLIILYKNMDQEHWLLKTILMFFIPLLFLLAGGYANITATGTVYENLGNSAYKIITWFIRIFYIYIITGLFFKAANFLIKPKKGK